MPSFPYCRLQRQALRTQVLAWECAASEVCPRWLFIRERTGTPTLNSCFISLVALGHEESCLVAVSLSNIVAARISLVSAVHLQCHPTLPIKRQSQFYPFESRLATVTHLQLMRCLGQRFSTYGSWPLIRPLAPKIFTLKFITIHNACN